MSCGPGDSQHHTVPAGITWRTVAGAIIVSFSENTIMDVLNRGFGLSLALKPLMPMAIIILVLITRPAGLSGIVLRRKRTLQAEGA